MRFCVVWGAFYLIDMKSRRKRRKIYEYSSCESEESNSDDTEDSGEDSDSYAESSYDKDVSCVDYTDTLPVVEHTRRQWRSISALMRSAFSVFRRKKRTTILIEIPQMEEEPHIKDSENIPNEYICCICFQKKRTVNIYPCNHLATCIGCIYKLVSETEDAACPICRTKIQRATKVFF